MKHAPIVRQAAIWKRILAFITDIFVVAFVCIFLVTLTAGDNAPTTVAEALNRSPGSFELAAGFYVALFFYLYHVFCEYIVGQTLGMFMWGVHVEKSEKTKEPLLRFGQVFLRNLFIFPLLPGVVLGLLWIVEPIYYVLQGRRLLEYVSKTDTVEYAR